MAVKDYYLILGLKKDASLEAIKSAFRRLALEYHPDRHPDYAEAEEKFKEINEAYAVLADPEKRAHYDRLGATDFHRHYSREDIFRGFNAGNLFREMGFGSEEMYERLFGGGHRHHGRFCYNVGREPGEDINRELTITFRDAYTGGERTVVFTRNEKREEITVNIPAGIDSGARVRIPGKGGEGQRGGEPGDLNLMIRVAGDPLFSRKGDDIVVEKQVSSSEALLGTSLDVETLEGTRRIKVPAGIQPGTRIRLEGLGFPHMGREERGDFYVRIGVSEPDRLQEVEEKGK